MNQDPSLSTWPENGPDGSLVPPPGETDFSSILELDFDLAELEKAVDEHDRAITTSAMDVSAPMGSSSHLSTIDAMQTSQPQHFNNAELDSHMHPMDMHGIGSMETEMNSHFYMQKQSQQQQQQQRNVFPQTYSQNHFIPPTPNSTELHGGARNYPSLDTGMSRRYEREDRECWLSLLS